MLSHTLLRYNMWQTVLSSLSSHIKEFFLSETNENFQSNSCLEKWGCKDVRVSQSVYQIKVLWSHLVLQYHMAVVKAELSLRLFQTKLFSPSCPCLTEDEGTSLSSGDPTPGHRMEMQGITGTCPFSLAPLGMNGLPWPVHCQTSSDPAAFHWREIRLPPVVGGRERGKWGRVCFELLYFHNFVDKSRNYIFTPTQ